MSVDRCIHGYIFSNTAALCPICSTFTNIGESLMYQAADSSGQVHIIPQSIKASKNDNEKVDLSLIPTIALTEAAKAFMVGEKKYGRYNYCKGHKASQLIAAMMRHATAWFDGEEKDPIDGQHHLGSVIACAAMILKQQELNTLTDDRYKQTT